ncbi:hypothetical protein JCM33374_g2286 [Metschnikowia sp. JCM 33374]|nr:hypothetical protein JCM33374_g2286 [Metschnikowia sp. JCM 33374]
MTKQHIVLDNGAYSIKAGFTSQDEPVVVENVLAKARDGVIYIGNDYKSHANLYSGINFKRPHEQGNLTSWETQKPVWDYTFDQISPKKEIDPQDVHLTLTESPFQLPQLSMNTDLIVFEEYGFSEYYRCTSSSLVPWAPRKLPVDFALVIDCGYSSTHIIPVLYQRIHWKGVRKLPFGGRHLNGLLREMISFRHYDVSDEPILINTVKEQTMFVASNFEQALRNKINAKCEFVLPDFKNTITGYVRENDQELPQDAQFIQLFDERFTVPESFFHPEIMLDNNAHSKSSVIQNASFKNITDLVVESIMSCPEIVRPMLSANINFLGGTANLKNFQNRLLSDLKKELPTNWTVKVTEQEYPLDQVVWHGGCNLAEEDIMNDIKITKQEFFEHGANWCQKQFGFKNFTE